MTQLDKWLLCGWDSKRGTRWEQTRAKGKLQYIFVNALLFGLLMLLVTTIKLYVYTGTLDKAELPFHLIQGLVTGLMFGIGMWLFNERGYLAHKASEQHSPSNNGI